MKKKLVFVLSLIILVGAVFAVYQSPLNKNNRIFQNRLTKTLFRPTIISFGKLPDLFFFPYFFYQTNLEVYNLNVAPDNLARLNNSLPEDVGQVALRDINKVFVPAVFAAGDYAGEVKVRYRGNLQSHWIDDQKSWLVQFPSDRLFNGWRELNLVIPHDQEYFIASLNAYRAKKLGVETPEYFFVRLNINGRDYGVYLASEHWSQEWIEKRPLAANGVLFGLDDGDDALRGENIFSLAALSTWKSWNNKDFSREELRGLIETLDKTDDALFKKLIPQLIDLDKLYNWNIINILSGTYHQIDEEVFANNMVLFFDPIAGKFEPVLYNLGVGNEMSYKENSKLLGRILSIPEFKAERNRRLSEYINNPKNLEDDLAFYDFLAAQMKKEFFSDMAKRYNNFRFLKDIKLYRQYVADNFKNAQTVIENEYDLGISKALGAISDKRLLESAASPEEFLIKHPEFYITYEEQQVSLRILPGVRIFRETVIVPQGVRLIIDPGTTLYFSQGASLVSYSPVIVRGAIISPLYDSWGVFAVVNTERQKSVFDNVSFRGGSEAKINGIEFTGMLALHNADGEIRNSIFEEAGGDDALNIKRGYAAVENSLFQNNSADGIDVDFPLTNTVIKNNTFFNNNGDAIDLSWSDIMISGNTVKICGDKGISVGEASKPTIKNNAISGCAMGIAVKDSSEALLQNNNLSSNGVGISLYQKKDWFGGGTAVLKDNILVDNKKDVEKDELSKLLP